VKSSGWSLAGVFAALAGIVAPFSMALAQPSAAPAAARPKDWPIEAFAALPMAERPSLSPDGLRFAAKFAVNGELRLVIVNIKDGPNRIRSIGLGENDLNWWSWVNDEWLVAGVGNEQSIQGMTWYLTRTVSIKADGSKINMLARNVAAQNADDVIWIAHDGSPRILLSYQSSPYFDNPGFWPRVDEIDVVTGRMKRLIAPHDSVRSWYADGTGTVRMGVGYTDRTRTSKLLYRPNADAPFRIVDKADRRRKESLVVPLVFLADPGKAIARDDRNGTDALYELDLTTLELGKKIFEAPGFDLGSVQENLTRTGLAGVRYTADGPEVHWFDPALAKIQADIDKAVGTRKARIISTSRDETQMIVHVGAPDQPGGFYYYDTAVGAMHLIARINDQFGNARLSPVRTVHYKARDGLDIAAVLTLPQGRDPKNLPLILMPHGGPFARDAEEWDWWAQFLAHRGYAVLQPNYRGSAGYGTAFAEKGEGQWGLAMQDDLNDAVDWAVAQGIADAKRVCMVGASYGGYAAMRAAQRDGSKYRCAVSYAGVSDLAAMMRYDRRFLDHDGRNDWLKEQAPNFAAVSPVNFAAQFSTPILLIHGKKDRRVQVGQSREMAEKLKAAGKIVGKDYIYVEQPLADHFFSRQADRLDFLQRLDAFLGQHNPAG
jgi:dipeptidyl aminopeptidase/acylaminoacyl peptidase